MIKPLAFYGDPVLRKKGIPVEEINDDIRQLITDMIDTMDDKRGVGFAAPQIHRSLTLFITRVPISIPGQDKVKQGIVKIYINPKILHVSEENWKCSEGCLSIPGLYQDIDRPLKVTVEATDLKGVRFTETCEGYEAHVILHENDHINGVLFVDRIRGKERTNLEPKLREIKNTFFLKKSK